MVESGNVLGHEKGWVMLSLRRRERGVSLIELMIGLALLAFILMMGVPAFGSFLQNQKLREAATTTAAEASYARAEAIRLNSTVELVLTEDEPDAGTFTGVAASTSGRNLLVRGFVYNPTTGQPDMRMLAVKLQREGSGQTDPDAPGVRMASTTGLVTFTPLGGTTLAADETIQITNTAGGECKSAGGTMRCLNVVITRGGQIRLCDPTVTTAGDTRACN
jgi:type IV fimbrial biogenesis protein FimT